MNIEMLKPEEKKLIPIIRETFLKYYVGKDKRVSVKNIVDGINSKSSKYKLSRQFNEDMLKAIINHLVADHGIPIIYINGYHVSVDLRDISEHVKKMEDKIDGLTNNKDALKKYLRNKMSGRQGQLPLI